MCQQPICTNYLTCTYGKIMPIYITHMKFLPLMMLPESLYMDTNEDDNNTNNNNDATA